MQNKYSAKFKKNEFQKRLFNSKLFLVSKKVLSFRLFENESQTVRAVCLWRSYSAVSSRDHVALNDKLSSLMNKEVKDAKAVTVLSLFE
jgi:hypothetical protein